MDRLLRVCLLLIFRTSVGSESSCLPLLSLLGAVLCPVSFLSADVTLISGKWGSSREASPTAMSAPPSLPGSVKLAVLSALSCLCGLDRADTAASWLAVLSGVLENLFLLSFVFGFFVLTFSMFRMTSDLCQASILKPNAGVAYVCP